MAVLMTPPYLEFMDADGNPLSGGKVYTYAAGTSDPKAAFTDSTETVQLPNPIILDAAGRAVIWIAGSYKFVITDALDNIIRTVDNVTSFNATDAAANSYFQSFSGNGSQTVFTLSEDLGDDENAIMVFVNNGGATTISNTPFFQTFTAAAAQTVYTLSQDLGTDENAVQVFVNTTTKGYEVLKPTQFTISGTTLTLSAAPTVTGADAVFIFKNPVLSGTIGIGFQIQNPNTYTLNGTSLTFITPPAVGTNNVMVFAPSTLVGAAAASAVAAENFANAANLSAINAAASETAAANSAIVAANQAASFVGTSTTSVTIGTGAKSFTTQTGKNFVVGEFVTIAYSVAPSNYMWGQVTGYNSGTGVLDVNVITTGGSGTQASWTIALSGERGVTGPAVSDGNKGDITVSAGGNTWTINSGLIRERLTANRTYYVRTDGSDSNNGLTNTAGGAFLTINKAINVASDMIDPAGFTITIQVGDGTYTTPVVVKPLIDGSVLYIKGNNSTPSNVVISTTSNNAISTNPYANFDIRDLRIQTTTSGVGISVTNNANCAFGNIVFGSTVFSQIGVDTGGSVAAISNYSIVGGSSAHIQIDRGGIFSAGAITVTLTGTPAFSASFIFGTNQGLGRFTSTTFSGAATGSRYSVGSGSTINTNGAGTSYFPGNAAGTGTNYGASPYGLYA